MIKETLKGMFIAAAAAGLFTACGSDDSNTGSQQQSQEVKCQGINDCKGHSDCQGAESDCKGLNDCKGKGYLVVASDQECSDKGGTVIQG